MLPQLSSIKRRRKSLDITQSKFAKIVGISQSAIAKIETGRMDPSYSIARKIFESLDQLETEGGRKAKDVMTRGTISLSPSDKIGQAKKIMKDKKISQLPVIENGFSLGSITESTIAFSDHGDFEKVSKIMNEPFPSVKENSSIKTIKGLLRENSAVIIQKNGQIVGIITKADLI